MKLLALIVLFSLGASPIAQARDIIPEPASAIIEKEAVYTTNAMAVTAHPLASQTAQDILKAGGSAVDAAIAAQLVLGLVEPQSSGIGGGGFLLHYSAKDKQVVSYDGRETAPSGVRDDMFLHKGKPIPFMQAVKSGKAVGTPGLVAMLYQAHQAHGKLDWEKLFMPAIELASEGFKVSPRLHKSIAYAAKYKTSPAFKALYLNAKGKPLAVGSQFKNPSLARVLEKIATQGPDAFYKGDIAGDIALTAQEAGGYLRAIDLEDYKPIKRDAICDNYRGYKICSMAPPSSGGLTILQTLKLLEPFTLTMPYGVRETHVILEAEKLAFADRDHFIADPDFVEVPVNELLAPDYLQTRQALISEHRANRSHAKPGQIISSHGKDNSHDLPSTTHLSIIDAEGNAVSMTSSVEHSFGSSLLVHGIALNNQLTDFAFTPHVNKKPVANRIEPYKRPRSSMSPTLIFKPNGKLHMVVGSPGGSSIIGYVLKTIIGVLDWEMPLQDALNTSHFMHKNQGEALLEMDHPNSKDLESFGHKVREMKHTSGVHAILIEEDGTLVGAADTRREGVALGY